MQKTDFFPQELELFDRMTADMVHYTEDQLDMSRLVLEIYGRAVTELNKNPLPVLDFLDSLDDQEQLARLTPDEQDRANKYKKCRPVFDELFLRHVQSSQEY